MSNFTAKQIADLTSEITGELTTRSANKAAAEKKFMKAASEASIDGLKVLEAETFEQAVAIIASYKAPPVPLVTEEDLDGMGLFGLGDETVSICPHCGIDHVGNGYQVHGDDFKCDERTFCCLGCNGEWGPKIRRRANNGRNSPSRGYKIYLVGGKNAENPFRPGTKSHAAFKFVQDNPGTLFEDLKAMGVRMRTVTKMIRLGMARRQQ